MARNTLQWKFPAREIQFLRIEVLFVAFLTVLIFLVTLFQLGDGRLAALYAALFLIIYGVLSVIVQKIGRAEAHYAVRGKHLHIVKKTLRKTVKEKIPLREVVQHKVDKVFLGGSVLTKKGRKHALFFNTRKEAEGFERMVKRQVRRA